MTHLVWVWVPRTGGTSLWDWLCANAHVATKLPGSRGLFDFGHVTISTWMHAQPRRYPDLAKAIDESDGYILCCREPAHRAGSMLRSFGRRLGVTAVAFVASMGRTFRQSKYHHQFADEPQVNWLPETKTPRLLLRFENLDASWRALCRRFALPVSRLPWCNASKLRPDALLNAYKASVREFYHADYREFGY